MNSNPIQHGGRKRQGILTRHLRWLSPSLVAVVAFMLFSAAPAKADATYVFTLTNASNTMDVSFSFPTTFTPASFVSGEYFQIAPVSYTLNGVTEAPTPVSFWNASQGGGMILGDYGTPSSWMLNQGGAQFYTGTEAAPTGFNLGTYSLTDWGGAQLSDNFTLTIVDPPGSTVPAPEPSSLLMLGVGLLGVSGLITYHQKKQARLAEATETV